MAAEEECDYLFKAVMVGNSAVGKSNLLARIAGGEFRLDSRPTIGVEFAYRDIRISGSLVKAQIWDTAGQERFRAITSSYYRGALGALLVYDVTRRSTFLSSTKWLEEMRGIGGGDDMVIVLVGNKSDLRHMREVAEDEGRLFAEQHGLCFMETSALENCNVEEAFVQMVTRIHEIRSHRARECGLREAGRPVAAAGEVVVLLDDEVTATKKEAACCRLH